MRETICEIEAEGRDTLRDGERKVSQKRKSWEMAEMQGVVRKFEKENWGTVWLKKHIELGFIEKDKA